MPSSREPPYGFNNVFEVFTPTQPARLNFVQRRAVNDQLIDALMTPGKQLIVFGESGSGKSSLLRKKLDETYPDHVTTRCHGSMTFDQLVLSAFDKLDHYYVDGREQGQARTGAASLGADFLKFKSAVDLARSSTRSETEARIVPPQLTVQRLGEFMGDKGLCWLIEDFHKMPAGEKVELSQSLKVFSDLSSEYPSLKIITIGATETARQVVECDPEMRNRVSELLVPLMTGEELAEILDLGSRLLNVSMAKVADGIVQYAVGVPSVCHQLALNVCLEKGIHHSVEFLHQFVERDMRPAADRYVRESTDTLRSAFDLALYGDGDSYYAAARLVVSALAQGPLAGRSEVEILTEVRRIRSGYPEAELAAHLDELQAAERGPLIRKARDGRYRFVDPVFHTYAKAALGVEMTPTLTRHVDVFFSSAVEKLLDYDRLGVRTLRLETSSAPEESPTRPPEADPRAVREHETD